MNQKTNFDIESMNENIDKIIERIAKTEVISNSDMIMKQYVLNRIEDQYIEILIQQQSSYQEFINQEQVVRKVNSQQENYLNSLNLKEKEEFYDFNFLGYLIYESYGRINQRVVFTDEIPEVLKMRMYQRLIGFQKNNYFSRVIFQSKNQTYNSSDFNKQLNELFQSKYPTQLGNYFDLACIKDQRDGSKHENIFCYIFQTNRNQSEIIKLISQLDMDIIDQYEEKKNKYLQLCKNFIDKRGNANFLNYNYSSNSIGGRIHNYPHGCLRVGIEVWNRFDNTNNEWLGNSNKQGEYSVVYTLITQITLCDLQQNTLNQNSQSNKQYKYIQENSFQCSERFSDLISALQNDPQVSSKLIINIGNQKFIIGYQCRVNPIEIQENQQKYPSIIFLDRDKKDILRPYQILIYQLQNKRFKIFN